MAAFILAGALPIRHAVTAATRGPASGTAFWWSIGFAQMAPLPAILQPQNALEQSV